ncbi:MAG: ADP-forming succinate--CoA ligase subunit beta [Chloroflexota bacterium]|nr:ADP-forming succinate--CoA ligase subunit beta [Chloroflexota bacterium]
MKVHESDARQIFADRGLPVPPSRVATTPNEAAAAAAEFGGLVVVKALVLAGGRGKAGGVKLADGAEAARDAAQQILGLDIRGEGVRRVLVAPAVDIDREIYLGVTIDRERQSAVVMASAAGGIDIEEVAAATPEAIQRIEFDVARGVEAWQARAVGFALGLGGRQVLSFIRILDGLVRVFMECDASLAEVNPLVVSPDGTLWAIDAKLNIDDNALGRRPELEQLRDADAEEPAEARARDAGISYIKLDGDIGCMVNGAGLAMATMDVVKHYGGEPANFLDVGGGAGADRVSAAFAIILDDPNVRAVFVNIFGGITRADEVARGVLAARESMPRAVPLVVRLMGTNEAEGLRLLADAGIQAERSMDAAARLAVEAVQ